MTARTVEQHMTECPHSIGRTQPLKVAHELMREHRIRHLPVLDAGQVIGVVSIGDLHLLETLKDVDPARVLVEEAMSQEVYSVVRTTPLVEVVRVMRDRKLGSAIVVENGRPVGVFTTIDALSVLVSLL